MITIGDLYPETMKCLKDFALLYMKMSPSKQGKRAELIAQVMMQVAPEQPKSITQINTGYQQKEGGEKS